MKNFYEWLSYYNNFFNEQQIDNPENTSDPEKLADQYIFESNRVNSAKYQATEIIKKVNNSYQENVGICNQHIEEIDDKFRYAAVIDPKTNDYKSGELLFKDYEDKLKNMSVEDISKFYPGSYAGGSEFITAAIHKKIMYECLEDLRKSHSVITNSYGYVLPQTLPYIIALKDLKTPDAIKANDGTLNFELVQQNSYDPQNPKINAIMQKYYKPAKDLPQFYSPDPNSFVPRDYELTPQQSLRADFEKCYFALLSLQKNNKLVEKIDSHFSTLLKNAIEKKKNLSNRPKIPNVYDIPCVFEDKSIESDFIEYVAAKTKPVIINNMKYGMHKHMNQDDLKRMPQGIKKAFS